jgi:hypothetical protein
MVSAAELAALTEACRVEGEDDEEEEEDVRRAGVR